MSALFWFAAPIILVALASIGAGILCLLLASPFRLALPPWLFISVAYCLGQGVLTTVWLAAALAGRFTLMAVAGPAGLLALTALVAAGASRSALEADVKRAWNAWWHAAPAWKLLTVTTAMVFAYGFSSLGGHLWVDGPAFYMAFAKLIAGTGLLTVLPGYEDFSSVGLSGELLMAAHLTLGMPGTTPRIVSYVNFIPALVLLYGLARLCGVGRRGSLLVVAMAVSSSSIAALWASGKTDLFAVGPALAACVVLAASWNRPLQKGPLILAGLLMGMAAVAKLSYVVAFVPALSTLVIWRSAAALRSTGEARLDVNVVAWPIASSVAVLWAGVAVALVPHLIKNLMLLGTPLGATEIEPYFTSGTTLRLVLTYPFALTYGRYWGQAGTLSPLVLAFAPMALYYLRIPRDHLASPLLGISVAASIGLAAWLLLYPSVITVRYFQATLLLFGLPAGAAAEAAARQSRVLACLIPPSVAAVLLLTPVNTDIISPTFSTVPAHIWGAMATPDVCSGSEPFLTDCRAHESVNSAATPGDRVLGLSYVRFWLTPELIQSMSTADEVRKFVDCPRTPCSTDEFWTRYRTVQPAFRFVIHDSRTHVLSPMTFEEHPADLRVRPLFSAEGIAAYEVTTRGQ